MILFVSICFNIYAISVLISKFFLHQKLLIHTGKQDLPQVLGLGAFIYCFAYLFFIKDDKYVQIYAFYKEKHINEAKGKVITWSYVVLSFLFFFLSVKLNAMMI